MPAQDKIAGAVVSDLGKHVASAPVNGNGAAKAAVGQDAARCTVSAAGRRAHFALAA
jgi:hypothetical protein